MSNAAALSHTRTSLTGEQVSRYVREGWLLLPSVLDESDLATIRRCCIAAEERGLGGMVGESAVKSEEEAELFAYQTHENYRRMFRNDHNLRLAFPELRGVVAKLGTFARQLMGQSDIRVMWDKTFNKPPIAEGTRPTVWHQDMPYVPLDRRGFMTFWMPLEDVDSKGGALRFVPGSQRLGSLGRISLSGDTEPSLDELLRPEDRELIGAPVTVPVPAGGATVHDGLMLHGAGPNLTDKLRRAWSCVFIPGDGLWTGGPFPHANFNGYGLKPFHPFDHPDLMVD